MAVLDESIANLALPAIGHDLLVSPASSVWIVSAYQIAITMALLPFSAAGDIVGHRRVYLIGLALFSIASLSCVMAGTITQLAAARFVQGIGAGAIMAVNGALVRFTYPREQLGRGIGHNAFLVAVCFTAGPPIAAAILSVGSWRWLFAINVPLGILALAIGTRALPDPVRSGHRFDRAGAVLSATALGCFFFGLAQLAHARYSFSTLLFLGTGVIAGVATIIRSRGQQHSLIPLDLLKIPALRLSYQVSIAGFAAHVTLLITLPYFLVARMGFAHARIGLLIMPLSLAVAGAALLASRAIERFAPSLVCAVGMMALGVGALLLGSLPPGTGAGALAFVMTLCGFGLGLFQTPNNRTMVILTPRARSGVGSGMTAIARLMGQTTAGVAVAMLFRLDGPATRAPLYLAAGLAMTAALVSLRRRHVIDAAA